MKKYIIAKRFSLYFRPKGRDRISQLLAYAGIDANPEIWLGSRLLIVFLFGLVGVLVPFSLFPFFDLSSYPLLSNPSLPAKVVVSLLTGLFFAAFCAVLIYMHLYYLIAERTQRVEKVLPDFLLMVAANLRSGMTPFAAFQASARPEFGPLQTEIALVSNRSLGSESFSEALRGLTENIDSPMLRRMVSFFENELRSGGKLAHLLETSAEEIRETEEVRRQMIIAAKSYAIFLGFILVFGLPLLLAISNQFLFIFTRFEVFSGADATSSTMLAGFSQPKIKIDANFIDQMAYLIIIGTSILTSILIGLISEGKLLYGL
ncbi:MAG: type II secretion system F family protein, partial [Candidatus Micrarchaeota archaeon]|nr:type II secretion system F family protein [Candidatus Micrarchaeota archaeon]